MFGVPGGVTGPRRPVAAATVLRVAAVFEMRERPVRVWRLASPQRLAKPPAQELSRVPTLRQELLLSLVQQVTLALRPSVPFSVESRRTLPELQEFPQPLVLAAEFAERVVVLLLAASQRVQAQARAQQSRFLRSFVAEHFSEVQRGKTSAVCAITGAASATFGSGVFAATTGGASGTINASIFSGAFAGTTMTSGSADVFGSTFGASTGRGDSTGSSRWKKCAKIRGASVSMRFALIVTSPECRRASFNSRQKKV